MEKDYAQVSENHQRLFHYTREMEKEKREPNRKNLGFLLAPILSISSVLSESSGFSYLVFSSVFLREHQSSLLMFPRDPQMFPET